MDDVYLLNILKPTCLRDAPTGLTFNNCTLCPHCIYVFCIYLRTNSVLCHLQHKLIGFCIYLSSFRSCDSCRRLPEPKHNSFLFNHWSSKCLVFMAARTPFIHIFLGFCNRDEKCLQRGTDWVFKYSCLCFVFSYVMHHQLNIQQFYALPTLYLCVLYLSENKQRLVPLTA